MAEYIERETAMDIFGEGPMWTGYFEPYPLEVHLAIVGVAKLIREEIGKIPAADVTPVVHGEWTFAFDFHDYDFYRCSVCGRLEILLKNHDINAQCPYCHCGAKMDGKDEGDGQKD